MDSPYVTINLNRFKENIDKIKSECKGISFIFPIKCCTNKKVLKIVNEKMDGFDVSNRNEYEIIKEYKENKIICSSGPMSYELKGNKNVYVALNNISDFDLENGLRINFNDSTKFQKSHFGTSISLCSNEVKENVKYLHFHNSDEKDNFKCEQIYEQVRSIITQFKNIKILNIGGHLEDLSWEDGVKYLKKIRKIIPNNISLIAEVGDFLFKECGTLYCKAVDCKIINDEQIIILNFSRMANQKWVHPYLDKKFEGEYSTNFYGNSCCEADCYLEKCRCKKIEKGQDLIFNNISTYGYQWNNNFNGINKIKYIFK